MNVTATLGMILSRLALIILAYCPFWAWLRNF